MDPSDPSQSHNNFFNSNNESSSFNSTRVVHIPPTTDSCIVFPFNDSKDVFDKGFYHPSLTEGRASKQDVINILTQFEAIIKEGKSGNGAKACCFVIFFLGGFAVTASSMSASGSAAPIVIFFILFALVGCMCAMNSKAQEEETRTACQQIINRSGQWKTIGLRWNIPMDFPHWVELWKDYRGAPYNYQNGPYAPPPA